MKLGGGGVRSHMLVCFQHTLERQRREGSITEGRSLPISQGTTKEAEEEERRAHLKLRVFFIIRT